MEDIKITAAKTHITSNCSIQEESISWVETTMFQIEEEVRNSKGFTQLVYLIYSGDAQGRGNPIDKSISREEFLKEPGKYGISAYKQPWSGKVVFE